MYSVIGRNCMTDSDIQFLKKVGVEPCHLDDPFPSSLSEKNPEPDFSPPKNLREYLTLYPTGIRKAVEAAAKELGLDLLVWRPRRPGRGHRADGP